MLSWASSRRSSGVVFCLQHLGSRALLTKSQSSSSSSSLSGCNNEHTYKGRSSGSSSKGSAFDLFQRSFSSAALILSSSIGYSYWSSSSSSSSSSSNPNPAVCFADAKEEATWKIEDSEQVKSFFSTSFRRKKFFAYEKKLRLQSTHEKIFNYFASVRDPDGEMFMTPGDLMRAVVPVFPPSDSNRVREGSLYGENVPVESGELRCAPSKFFMLFDTDGDGLISFQEYLFFVTLLSIPESSFTVAFKMFDLNDSGDIDKDEFNRVMELMRIHNNMNKDSHKVRVGVEEGGILEYFFGKDGQKGLKHERFVQFFRDLHEEMLRLEFAHYDHKAKGTISAKDFAFSLVASADISDLYKLLDRVDDITNNPRLNNIQITYKEFRDFAELRKNLKSFSLAIFSYGQVNGVLTKADLQRAISKVCGIKVTDNVLDIIFHVFDAYGDGDLSASEFVKALQNRGGEQVETGLRGLLTCFYNRWHPAHCGKQTNL